MTKIRNILFVCLGNTARSPAAEYLAKFYAKKESLNLRIQSAGFLNAFSYMQPESKHYLHTKGIDSSDFKPQLITLKLLDEQDLILTMETSHKTDILNAYKDIEGLKLKVLTLKEYNGEINDLDINDPYYTSQATYQKILEIIDDNVQEAIKKIKIINMSNLR